MTSWPPLVSIEWLRKHCDRPEVVILDSTVLMQPGAGGGEVSTGLGHYLDPGHIPGARFADLITEFSDPAAAYPFTLPDQSRFEAAAGRLGLTPDTHVIVYDALAGQWAARLWWVFRTFGHRAVSVLDGGLKKYVSTGGSLDTQPASFGKSTYSISGKRRPFARKSDVLEVVTGKVPGHLLCFLQPADYAGAATGRERPGHIPGSINIPFSALLNQDNTLLDPHQLRSLFAPVLSADQTNIITYCGIGVASTLGNLALTVLGRDDAREYDGSMAEWAADPTLPIATGKMD